MIYEIHDIAKLIDSATKEEKVSLANVLKLEVDDPNGDDLAKQLLWKYQTPIGYLVKTPTFNDITIATVKKFMKIPSKKRNLSCWNLLNQLTLYLFNKMFDEMDDENKETFLKTLLSEDKIKEICGDSRSIKWEQIRPAVVIASIPSYVLAVTVSTQVAYALFGTAIKSIAPRIISAPIILGPLGWLLVAWGLNDLLGTNWKQVIPGILYINCIYERLKDEGKLPF